MPTAPSPRLLVLDCDGVLVRSERANVAYYNHIFRTFELPAVCPRQREQVRLLHTLSTPQVIDHFVPEELRREALEFVRDLSYDPFLGEVTPEPGWGGVLDRWRTQGAVAVATNRGTSARAVLDAVDLLRRVDLVLTIRDVSRPKPHPDLLLRALDHFSLAPGEALYVGDSDLDREAASRAGVPFLGFRRQEPPSVESPEAVEEFLRRLASVGDFASLLAPAP